ncbi:transcription initiation factor IIB [Candidatus Nitrosocosmicus franklandus]|uniref:Transcription initiation factor IIB n=1 Tax=Candidatus Nitrosocosmicus franklandianus TaxID=1798806 RepID=A0A484I823_9ARCH|nr:transcription initiation factor IIB family protein [Candidatus Nitrosocosmicus franklandus]VFJ13246.1 Transcription initiation factor IIB [Candidatus Nitrosocosmicus franklandus]
MHNSLILNQLDKITSSHQHSIIYDYDKGEKLCKVCGVIVQDKIFDVEFSADFYKYKSDTNTALPQSVILNDKGMSTSIADYDATSSKRFSNRKEHNKIEFLNKIVSCSNKKRNLKIVIDLLNRIKDKLSLTSACIEEALQYYKKALEKGMIKGRSIKEMIVACVYLVCKKVNIPRTLSEISQVVEADEIFAARCYRLLMRELKITHVQFKPTIFIRKIADEANINERTARESIDLLLAIQNENIFLGKNSLSIAAAILYLTCRKHKQKISQARIAYAASINIMTLRKRLSEVRNVITNASFLN